MNPIFTVILVILAILAVLDLIIGVSNDAINFLNSSLGSKVASFKVILIVASCGILVGVLTSHGMMEVARNGVFHPEMFHFNEIMFLFVGMMLSDVILLNTFNGLGLPTSTTVSLIFELLGSAVAVSIYKIANDNNLNITDLGTFINSGKALVMISAILVSVVLSFFAGSITMYLSRLIFTFRYSKQLKRYGAIWCGVSIVGIVYFAIFNGLKSSGFITTGLDNLIRDHIWTVLLVTWAGASFILWILQLLKVSILKVTILSGTFALALAFAGNDLVNFIGVPMAGLDSYKIAMNSGDMSILMTDLTKPTSTDTWILFVSGLIMAVTLFFSKDAMKVSQTELTLASQHDEDERFNSSPISRVLVRSAINLNTYYKKLLPNRAIDAINRRFIPLSEEERGTSNYDKIRAVVNLASAAILICIGTSLKLPLSTTYVVFMVAMGSSLADHAWGRDSAVYRISGVMVVIMGWFLTAIIGFALSFLITAAIMWGGNIALAVMVVISGYAICNRLIFFGNKKKHAKAEPLIKDNDQPEDVLYNCTQTVCTTMEEISHVYNHMLVSLFTENRKELKEMVTKSEEMYHEANSRKYSILTTIKKLEKQNVETAHFYVQVVDYLCEVSKALLHITRPAYEHINNNHRGLSGEQIKDLKVINDRVDDIFAKIDQMLINKDFTHLDDVLTMREELFDVIADTIKRNIKRLQADPYASSRAGALFLNILSETKTMILQARNLIKSQAYFLNAIQEEDAHEKHD
jgi:phosphate/sulfate permease